MKKLVMLAVVLLAAGAVRGQNCQALINDDAGIIKDHGVIERAAQKLIDQGADVKVVTVKHVVSNLRSVEDWYEQRCPNWTMMMSTGNQIRKPNLFVVMLAPNDRLKNVFVGSGLTNAVGSTDTIDAIYSQAANSYFHVGDWGDGFAATLLDFGSKVATYHDQAKHPVVAQTTNQATDLKPVASVAKVFMVLFFIGVAIIAVILGLHGMRRRKEEREAAQQEAMGARAEADQLYIRADKEAPGYGDISYLYNQFSNSVGYDPNQAGLTKDNYFIMKTAWNGLAQEIRNLKFDSTGATVHVRQQRADGINYVPPVPEAPTPIPPTAAEESQPKAAAAGAGAGDSFLRGAATGYIADELLRPRPNYNPNYDEDHHVVLPPPDDTGEGWPPSPYIGDPTPTRDPDPEPEPDRSSSGSDSTWSSSSDDSSSSSGSDSSWSDSSSSSDSGSSGSDSSF